MKVKLTVEHVNLLRGIAANCVLAQDRIELDTGPGGEDSEQLAKLLHSWDNALEYFLNRQDFDPDAC